MGKDQLLAWFPIMRKCEKGYKKVFFHMIDIAVYNVCDYANTFGIRIILKKAEKLRIVNFRISIAEDMLFTILLPNYFKRGRPSQVPSHSSHQLFLCQKQCILM